MRKQQGILGLADKRALLIAELVCIQQRNYSKQMDGESKLLDDLSSTETMMTLPSFHNTGDYITDRPCLTAPHWRLWEWLTVTAYRLPPHSTFWCYRNQWGISGPGRPTEAQQENARSTKDRTRLWKLKRQQRSFHFPIHPLASVLLVPMNWEIKDGKC